MKRSTIVLSVAICMTSFAQPREEDDRQAAREEWFYNQRAYPLGRIPPLARVDAINAIRRIDAAARLKRQQVRTATVADRVAATLDAATWTLIGPRPTDAGSSYITAGRVNAIAIDPRDNNVVYIGAAEGGVWKTTDGGINWKPITDDQPSLASGTIALDPSNPDIVYVGTGEENFAQDSYYGAGILKSMNGGKDWTHIPGPFLTGDTRASIGALAIHPTNSQILLCSSNIGIYRSTDGAATWTQVRAGIGTGVLFDPTNGNIAYAALGATNGSAANGVYRSADAGLTWRLLTGSGANALPTANVGRIELAIAPSTPSTLYVGIQRTPARTDGRLIGIYKTTDSGNTWNNTNAPDICANPGQCWYDLTIRVHPRNPDIVFAFGSANALARIRSMDGGATWQSLPAIGPNRVEIHVDNHYLAFTPDGGKLFVANDGGVYSTTDVTSAAVNWTEINDTLAITQFYPGLSIHPANANTAYAGAQDNGTQRYNGALSWNNVTCGDGGFTAIDLALPSTAYAACQDIAVRRSVNGGNSWIPSQYGFNQQDRSQFIAPLVIDPSNPQILYFGTFRVYQTKDGAGRWIPISPDVTGGNGATIHAIAPAPSDPNTVYVGSSDINRASLTTSAQSRIQVTNNALDASGASWNDRSTGLPPRALTQIKVDPIDPATAYATFSGFASGSDTQGHIFKTSDSGAHWADASGNLPNIPLNDVVVDPDIPNTLYVATDAGVMVTTDGGNTWSSLGNGLPRVVVHSLVLHRASRTLRAATHGRSVWDILAPLSGSSQQPTITSISPSNVNAGSGDFSLSVTGTNFVAGAKLRWNGLPRSTNVVDSTHVTAQIPATDIVGVGRAAIDVFNSTFGAGVSNSVTLNIGPAPGINTGGVVNAANPTSGLAPGSIASLYGTNLAPTIASADVAPPLPFTLAGVTLPMTNVAAAALFYVSSTQVNFQIPWYILSNPANVGVTVMQGATSSSTLVFRVVPYAPAIFTANQTGAGQGAVLISGSGGALAAPSGAFPGSRPVNKGEFLEIYATGLGAVNNNPGPGASPGANPSTTTTMPLVSIGGMGADVSFSGLAPGFVGLYQINVKVPDTAPSGPAVPLVLTIGGVPSNSVTIAVN